MTNPNNAIGTNAAYGGRTSVNAFNDDLAAYNRGIMSGWQCVPNTGLTVSVGGVSGTRDVAIAEDNIGNKTTINNISFAPVNVSLAAAPVANSRIDLIVVYVDGSPDGTAEDVDNPSACGIISVKGTAAASPVEPSDSDIRDAITADGASGSTAYYTVLASVTIASGVTELTSAMIVGGVRSELALIGAVVSEPTSLAYIDTVNIVDEAVTADKIDFSTLSGNYSTIEQSTGFTWIDGSTIYKKTISVGPLPDNTTKSVPFNINNLNKVIYFYGMAYHPNGVMIPLPFVSSNIITNGIDVAIFNEESQSIRIGAGADRTGFAEAYITLYYTKTS